MKQELIKKKHREVEEPDADPSSLKTPEVDDLQACIAHRAYELYEQEGCCHVYDFYHWLQAEREVLGVEPEK